MLLVFAGCTENQNDTNRLPIKEEYSNLYVQNGGKMVEYEYDENDNLVKQVTTNADGDKETIEYIYNGDKITQKTLTLFDGDITVEKYTYNANGLIETVDINTPQYSSVTKNSYDQSGTLVKAEETFFDGTLLVEEYTYTETTTAIKFTHTSAEGKVNSREYIFDKNFNCIEKNIAFSKGNTNTEKFTYDEDGRLIKHESSGVLNGSCAYTYDDKGNLAQEDFEQDGYIRQTYYEYNADNKWIKKTNKSQNYEEVLIRKYDEQGRLIQDMPDYSSSVVVYEYDDRGNLISEKTSYEGTLGFTNRFYTYNEQNLRVKEKVCIPSSETETAYEYDENKNVIKEVWHSNGVISLQVERKYTKDGLPLLVESNRNVGTKIINSKTSYSYDGNGNCVKENYLGQEWINVYDEKNRMVRRFAIIDGKIESIQAYAYNNENECVATLHVHAVMGQTFPEEYGYLDITSYGKVTKPMYAFVDAEYK